MKGLSLKLQLEISIAPSQTRIVPLLISQNMPFYGLELKVEITMISAEGATRIVPISLPVNQLNRWTASAYKPIIATYFYSSSMPTAFVVVPPILHNSGTSQPPILALRAS